MKKRFLSMLLVIVMVVGMLPNVVSAETEDIPTSGYCGGEGDGTNLSWVLEDGILTISGTGAMGNYIDSYLYGDWECVPWSKSLFDITSVVVEEGVTGIGDCAFYSCFNLTSVYIPSSVTSIGDYAFAFCFNLPGITVNENNPSYSTDEYGVLFNKDKTVIIKVPETLSGHYTIPSSVMVIENFAFHDCYLVTSVTIPYGVVSIGNGAFAMAGLTSITMPDSVITLGEGAFNQCFSMTEVTLSNNLEVIPKDAFTDCPNLTELTIPASVTTISDQAFTFYGVPYAMNNARSVSAVSDDDLELLVKFTFCGHAPTFGADVFLNVGATAYYPANDETWTDDVMQDYGGNVEWIAYELVHVHKFGDDNVCDDCGEICDHVDKTSVAGKVDATCIAEGYTGNVVCSECGTIVETGESIPVIAHTFLEWVEDDSKRSCVCGASETRFIIESTAETAITEIVIESADEQEGDFQIENVSTSDDRYVMVQEALADIEEIERKILNVLDITLESDDVQVELHGTVTVRLALNWEKDTTYKVYHVVEDGTYVDINAYRVGEQLVFESDHFSLYALVEVHEHEHEAIVTKPTCTEAGYTTYVCDCGDIYYGDEVEANGHSYKNGACEVCGDKDPDYVTPEKPNKPSWGNIWDCFFGCWRGYHKYVSVVTEGTCENKGYTTHTCKQCGKSYKDSYTSARGHDWDEGKVTKKPTCIRNGEKTFTCENCSKIRTEVIAATGHHFKNGNCQNCGLKETTKPGAPIKPIWGWIGGWIGGWWK